MGVLGLTGDMGPGQLVRPVAGGRLAMCCWTSGGQPGLCTRPTPLVPPEPVPRAVHLAVAQDQGPPEGERCGPGASWRPPLRRHKENHSLLIRLPQASPRRKPARFLARRGSAATPRPGRRTAEGGSLSQDQGSVLEPPGPSPHLPVGGGSSQSIKGTVHHPHSRALPSGEP